MERSPVSDRSRVKLEVYDCPLTGTKTALTQANVDVRPVRPNPAVRRHQQCCLIATGAIVNDSRHMHLSESQGSYIFKGGVWLPGGASSSAPELRSHASVRFRYASELPVKLAQKPVR
jgi:hypothetical protein